MMTWNMNLICLNMKEKRKKGNIKWDKTKIWFKLIEDYKKFKRDLIEPNKKD